MTLLKKDPELLRAYRDGKTEAFERIYAEYGERVARFLQHRCRLRHTDLMDVLHGSFARAFSPDLRNAYREEHSFFNYMCGIANIEAARFVKSVAGVSSRLPPDEQDPEGSPEAKQEAAELLEWVMKRLTEKERAAVLAIYTQGRTQESAARISGLDRNKVRRSQEKARKLMVYIAGVKEEETGGRRRRGAT